MGHLFVSGFTFRWVHIDDKQALSSLGISQSTAMQLHHFRIHTLLIIMLMSSRELKVAMRHIQQHACKYWCWLVKLLTNVCSVTISYLPTAIKIKHGDLANAMPLVCGVILKRHWRFVIASLRYLVYVWYVCFILYMTCVVLLFFFPFMSLSSLNISWL